jgi:cytochrome c2
MARNHIQHRTAAIVLLIVALASCSLTACSSSNPTSQAHALSPREIAIQKRRDAGILEIFSCARDHGVRLPPPTAAGLNVSGVKGRRNAQAVSACYQKALKKAARQEHAERAEQAK